MAPNWAAKWRHIPQLLICVVSSSVPQVHFENFSLESFESANLAVSLVSGAKGVASATVTHGNVSVGGDVVPRPARIHGTGGADTRVIDLVSKCAVSRATINVCPANLEASFLGGSSVFDLASQGSSGVALSQRLVKRNADIMAPQPDFENIAELKSIMGSEPFNSSAFSALQGSDALVGRGVARGALECDAMHYYYFTVTAEHSRVTLIAKQPDCPLLHDQSFQGFCNMGVLYLAEGECPTHDTYLQKQSFSSIGILTLSTASLKLQPGVYVAGVYSEAFASMYKPPYRERNRLNMLDPEDISCCSEAWRYTLEVQFETDDDTTKSAVAFFFLTNACFVVVFLIDRILYHLEDKWANRKLCKWGRKNEEKHAEAKNSATTKWQGQFLQQEFQESFFSLQRAALSRLFPMFVLGSFAWSLPPLFYLTMFQGRAQDVEFSVCHFNMLCKRDVVFLGIEIKAFNGIFSGICCIVGGWYLQFYSLVFSSDELFRVFDPANARGSFSARLWEVASSSKLAMKPNAPTNSKEQKTVSSAQRKPESISLPVHLLLPPERKPDEKATRLRRGREIHPQQPNEDVFIPMQQRQSVPIQESTREVTSINIYLAMGYCLMAQGVFTMIYHTCPTTVSYLFDTMFMFTYAGLYSAALVWRRDSSRLKPWDLFMMLALVVGLQSLGILLTMTGFYWWWWIFLIMYLLWFSFWVMRKIPTWAWRCLCVGNVVFFATAASLALDTTDVVLLLVGFNTALTTIDSLAYKVRHGERITLRLLASIFLLAAAAIVSIDIFLREQTNKLLPLQISRSLNAPCVLGVFDYHDYFHLSISVTSVLFFKVLYHSDRQLSEQWAPSGERGKLAGWKVFFAVLLLPPLGISGSFARLCVRKSGADAKPGKRRGSRGENYRE